MFKSLINVLKNFEEESEDKNIQSSITINSDPILEKIEQLTNEIKELKNNQPQGVQTTQTQNIPTSQTQTKEHNYFIKEVHPNKLYILENFLNDNECEQFIDYISKNKVRSQTVNAEGKDEYSHFRTSSTCYINETDLDFIKNLDEKICNAANEKYNQGEKIQGQYYDVGQEFKEHTDWFEGKGYEANCKEQGNRTTTFMIYLNDVKKGGDTFFPRLNKRISPKKGMAVMWKNLDLYGNPDHDLRHTGEPILDGEKYIMTKWFRERAKGDNNIQMSQPQLDNSHGQGGQEICKRPPTEILHEHGVLSNTECQQLIKIIDEHKQKSTVVVGAGKTEYSQHRTSSSAYFNNDDPFIQSINNKLSAFLGIHPSFSEGVQGQVYEVGEEFKHHHDFFHNPEGDERFAVQGDRTWSLMVFLNHVEEGGETEFPDHSLLIKPEPGMAVFWKNIDIYGNQKFDTLHAGLPVKKGKKYIITKWYRQFPYYHPKPLTYSPQDFEQRSKELLSKQNQTKEIDQFSQNDLVFSDKKTLKSREDYQKVSDVPIFTNEGFKKITIPSSTWKLIQSSYEEAKDHFKDEYCMVSDDPEDAGIRGHIDSTDFSVGTLFSPIDEETRSRVTDDIRKILEQWSGRNLASTATYGFRSYRRGSRLKMHVDRLQTHVISATICVDHKSDTLWPLDIFNHEKKESQILMEPGEMVLYESARLAHGRRQRFDGDFYIGLFVHFIPV